MHPDFLNLIIQVLRSVNMADYKMPGLHIYDGIPFNDEFSAEILDQARAFPFHDDDVIVATHPKSGAYPSSLRYM